MTPPNAPTAAERAGTVCDRCGRPGATVERVQEGSHWWYHPECERPTPLQPDDVLDASEVADLQRWANRVEDIPACDVIRIVRAYQSALAAARQDNETLRSYVQHRHDCKKCPKEIEGVLFGEELPPHECTCDLDAAST